MSGEIHAKVYCYVSSVIDDSQVCDTLHCDEPAVNHFLFRNDELFFEDNTYFCLCERCALSNPVTGLMVSEIEERKLTE